MVVAGARLAGRDSKNANAPNCGCRKMKTEIGVIKRATTRPYVTAKDPEASLVDIKRMLMKYNLDGDKIQTGIKYATGQIYVIFEAKIPKPDKNIPMVLLFKVQARLRRVRKNGKMGQEYDLSGATRHLFHRLQKKLEAVSNGYATELEELLPFIVLSGTHGQTILDQISSTVESGRLSLASMSEALALPAAKEDLELGPVASGNSWDKDGKIIDVDPIAL